MADISYHGSGSRSKLRIVCERICLIQLSSVRRVDQELVKSTLFYPRNEKLVHAHALRLYAVHPVFALVPLVEVTDNSYTCSMWCPYIKNYSFFSIYGCGMCAHLAVDVIVCPLSKQVTVHLCKIIHLPLHLTT